jgi:hypothetical protein
VRIREDGFIGGISFSLRRVRVQQLRRVAPAHNRDERESMPR